MVVRNYIQCKTCSHKYRVRYNVGNRFPQSASFFCKTCGQAITYGYDGDKLILENATLIDPDESVDIITLHPELAIDETRQSDPYYFPSLDAMKANNDKEFFEFRSAQFSSIAYLDEWDKLAEHYRWLTEERWPLLLRQYGNDNKVTKQSILKKVIFIASLFLEGKWTALLEGVLKELENARKQPGFAELKAYLESYIDDFLLHRMYELMTQYRLVETELLSTLLELKLGNKPKGISSSAKWEKIERIYGDFYEVYGELAIIPTVVNNLITRGNYELFNTVGFTLDQYMETDKAKRCLNFSINVALNPLGDFYEAWLRNGTHHKTAKINKAKQKIVLKTGKGGKSEKVLSFVEYTEYCNELYARCLILLILYHKVVS